MFKMEILDGLPRSSWQAARTAWLRVGAGKHRLTAVVNQPAVKDVAPYDLYIEHMKRGVLAYRFDLSTGRALPFPIMPSRCDRDETLELRIATGLGTVCSTTVVGQRGGGEYSVSLIDCDEGFRVMSRVEGIGARSVRAGMRMRFQLFPAPYGGADLWPVFAPLHCNA